MGDFNVNSEIMLCRFDEIPTIASVSIDTSYPWESDDKHCHRSVCGFGIMDIGGSGGCFQNVAVFIRYYVAFYALYLLIAVNSLLGTRQCGTGTLTVNGSYSRM